MGNDGFECPVTCPMKCDGDDLWCYGGVNEAGCAMQDFCMPKDSECPPPGKF